MTEHVRTTPPGRNRPSRVIIADDHPLYRAALRRMLGEQPDLEVVAEAQDGGEALEICRHLRSDLVLMDARMPGVDGLEATRMIKREFPQIMILIVTAFEDVNLLLEAIREGASGYIVKTATPQQMINAIRKVLMGESSVNRKLAMRLLLRLIDERQENETEDLHSPLTPREAAVLQLVAQRQSNQQIARNLFISEGTVKKHVRQILAKLGASDRIQAVVQASKLGLLHQGGGPIGP